MSALLMRFWPEALVLAMLIAVGGAFAVLVAQRDHARAELTVYRSNYAIAQRANEEATSAIEQQNAAIQDLQKYAAVREQETKTAIAAAGVAAQPHEAKAVRLAGLTLAGDECKDLQALIDEGRAK